MLMPMNTNRSTGVAQSGSDLLVGVAAIAEFLQINPRSVGQLARTRGLPLARIGHHDATTRRALLEWVEREAQKRDGAP
jgi:hypothetical protein